MNTLTIKDLSADHKLDGKKMAAVRGGTNANLGNGNWAIGGILGSPAVVVAPVIQVDPFGFSHNMNGGNLNYAAGGFLGSPAVAVAPVIQA